ncbi:MULTISPECIES: SpaA isopeptide-forming pilin-related protein [Corynebacterium]|uniref:SpaA isopeptide-forming pilin-related protein n=1 Tax=Corynebacterium TaxID=1716 RepID=UPI0008A9D5AD|nr:MULTISPECIES: SpaA isopeptide-forming pilin-related protein [Corynebacterium]MBC6807110.1 VWA domain-containing protein [Corynebacterium sp. LK30]MCG7270110.1 LPXTG cell wall anchor domain-containing protein [Corynebacterium amycolatum]MDK8793800.1 SpaA isopeptide-forming pilin-related protein [Corynebacterium sp. MSK032]MDK8811030.1 SpaA isopeptide-forming pilin-related protein [Corynebacterium sp. MSK035]MDK8827824.1 SpaA isopeptide-forming pilin-related protein [Corynebacterium sp. MSK01
MFSTTFRLPDSLRTVLRMFLAALLAVALVVSGQAFAPNAPQAQAQTEVIPTTPPKYEFKKIKAKPNPGDAKFEFTVNSDATIDSLQFNVGGSEWLQTYELSINGRMIPAQFDQSRPPYEARRAPFEIVHSGLNQTVKAGDKINLELWINNSAATGSVSLTLRGTTAGSTEPTNPSQPTDPSTDPTEPTQPTNPTEPTEPTEPETPEPEPEPGTITPAEPTLVDPATAPECVEKAYINIPDTKGVDYYLNAKKAPAGPHVYEQNKPGTVKVTAVAQPGFKLAPNARTEWTFNLSGEVKNCSNSSEDPKPPAVEGRHFDAIGHEFAVKADPVDPKKPNAFTAKVTEESHMKYATVRIETDATFLDPQKYNLTLDQIEPGVTLLKRNVNIGNGFITMDVVPVKDGKPVDSALVPKDAVFTFTNNLSQNKNLKVTLDVYGEKKSTPKPPEIISPPDGAQWVHGRVANPPMPQRCGLRIAVVADLSTSLNYADSNGFTESKRAANALIDSLAGTPAELGIYNFAGGAPRAANGSTYGQNPPYISLQSEQGVNRAKSIVANWQGDGSTNWEAGLKQVAAGNYDVVYFITDGMPTYSSKAPGLKLGGEFVQESALNQAIDAANELKAAGTRIVPIMVDLTVGGKYAQRTTVTQDLVLKNVRWWKSGTSISEPGLYWQFTNKYVDAASYVGDDTTANFEIAYKNGGFKVWERTPQGRNIEITRDQSKWTYGPRGVKTMGEDISGTGDTIRVEQYSKLAAQMKQIGEQLASRCNGVVKVKKRIVDENGKVLEDGAPGWEFTLAANDNVIGTGSGPLVHQSMKVTSGSESDKGTASWNIESEREQSLVLTETQKQGYTLFRRGDTLDSTGDFNAVCTQTRGGKTSPLKVENVGEFGFRVKMSESNKVLSSISCVVDNYEAPDTKPGKLTLEKAEYVDGEGVKVLPGLGGATFDIYPSAGGQPDFSGGPVYTITPDQKSIEINETGTFYLVETKSPAGLSLLPEPVAFEISVDQETKEYTISVVGGSSPLIKAEGSGELMIMQVTDTKTGTLPKTGGNGVLLWTLFGAVIAACGWFWTRRQQA